jgi:PAS domain S-box-containing protein
VAMCVALLLVFTLHYAIQQPIKHLHNRLVAIKDGLVGGENLGRLNRLRIKVTREDEIGAMSRIINRMLRNLVHEFIKVQKASKTTMEYINAINEGSIVSKSDINGVITYVNKALCETTGYTEVELIGQPHNIFRHPNTPKQTFKVLWNTIQAGEVWHGLLKNRRKDGSAFYANVTIVPIKDARNRIVEYVALRDDVTELVNAKEELKKMFLTDPLTSFGNRFKMLDTIQSKPYSHLAIIDIHDFKEVNDFYGHKIGDKVILELANILFEYFGDATTEIFHLSGDEFAVLSDANTITFPLFTARIESFFAKFNHAKITVDEQIIPLQLTSGIAESSEHIVNYADIAHKHAKKSNRNIVVYSDEISTDLEYKKNLEWTAKIKEAIEENRIQAYYQPIYNNKTRRIEKYETLMRLIDAEGHIISPTHFLEIAKKTRHYPELKRIIVQQAFKQFEHSDYEFSVNLSAEDIILHHVGHYFFDLAKEYGVENRVVIELVESEGIESFDTVESFIQQAKSYGMKIAIDDFGTGYSNFEYLIRLNTDYLKIDGSLIRTLDSDDRLRSVVDTMVSFAQKNGIKTIAEFVATEPLQKIVEELDIDYSQGYFHGKPAPEPK